MQHFVKTTPEYGRGLYAVHTIAANSLLFTAELLVLSKEDTVAINGTDLKYYTFKYTDDQDCLVLGDGEIFNHSDSPNVGYKLINYGDEGRKVMAFFTLRPIEQYEQLFIDYNSDIKVNPDEYRVNLF